MLRCNWMALFCALAASCAKPGAGTTASTGGASTTGSDAATDEACRPAALGLGAAKPVALWTPPADCKLTTPNAGPPLFLHTEAAVADWLKCTTTMNGGLDLTRQTLVVVGRTLSPAGQGTNVYDDGKTLTLVSRSRNNCPDDPMPMPMTYAMNFLLPGTGDREVKESSCTIDSKCR